MTFRDALLHKLENTGMSLMSVAKGAQVSYEQLKKLKQKPDRRINVEDALKIANFFNQTLDDFISGKEESDRTRTIRVLDNLPPDLRAFLESYAEDRSDRLSNSPPQSDVKSE